MLADRRARTTDRDIMAVLLGLTFVTGIVDAVTYLGLGHVFAANMTGNIVLLGFALAGADQVSVSTSLVALGAFLAGAGLAGRLGHYLDPTHDGWIVTSLGLEISLLLVAMVGSALVQPLAAAEALVALLALAMGIRNAMVRRLGVPDITTTVMTMLLTVLAADTQAPGGGRGALARRLSAVAAMLFGAATGAVLLGVGGVQVAIGGALGVLVFVALGYLTAPRAEPLGRKAEAHPH